MSDLLGPLTMGDLLQLATMGVAISRIKRVRELWLQFRTRILSMVQSASLCLMRGIPLRFLGRISFARCRWRDVVRLPHYRVIFATADPPFTGWQAFNVTAYGAKDTTRLCPSLRLAWPAILRLQQCPTGIGVVCHEQPARILNAYPTGTTAEDLLREAVEAPAPPTEG